MTVIFITAHGGANNTGRNSIKYLDEMEKFNIDAIEVDIWPFKGELICNHNPPFTLKGKLKLREVFEYVKKRNIMINCDVKKGGLVRKVVSMAQKMDIENLIYFTGAVRAGEIESSGSTRVYVNRWFFRKYKIDDIVSIKKYLDSFDSIAGININYKYADEDFLRKCYNNELKVSLFTVDNLNELDRLLRHDELANITTNQITYVMNKLGRI